MSRSRNWSFPSVHMGSTTLTESSELRLLGLDTSSNLRWDKYISGIAQSASKRVGCLYRAQKYLPPDAVLLYLYKTTIYPVMEYCCYIWSGAPAYHLLLLDRLQKRIVNLVGAEMGSTLHPLSHRRSIATLSLFSRYFHGKCSVGLSNLVPPARVFGRKTRFTISTHTRSRRFKVQNERRCR